MFLNDVWWTALEYKDLANSCDNNFLNYFENKIKLCRMAIEEIMNQTSRNPSGTAGARRKRLDAAAHRMLLNSLSRPKPTGTSTS